MNSCRPQNKGMVPEHMNVVSASDALEQVSLAGIVVRVVASSKRPSYGNNNGIEVISVTLTCFLWELIQVLWFKLYFLCFGSRNLGINIFLWTSRSYKLDLMVNTAHTGYASSILVTSYQNIGIDCGSDGPLLRSHPGRISILAA